ncbi:glycosyltransferase family 2 protein [Roseibacterium sp. SDUM158016]|uniref:glycosyltransferase family 2 protein n=1 Tax=Roseicyclus sediminis TaxID=2980997 RepID=UPI0021CEA286|nr:glycosyltransferase family 2 protein [Roseibacterium sp. SDUM158016]MCU4654391.1 glycosyltransferase family 2 protein [Roseibacterium sp. SDUM158016]
MTIQVQPATPASRPAHVPLIVIPSLNEARHIERVALQMLSVARRLGGNVVIADGGSTDGSRDIAARLASRHNRLHLLDNPARRQASGINAAVAAFGSGHTHLIRVDAHSLYSEDFVDALLSEATETGASAVVVGMIAAGEGFLQRLNASTQNARIGNGGSGHRGRGRGEWVDHGHHALMEIAAFRAVGGYDPDFAHNEDAELDHRLRKAGHRIWLTGETAITYFPRSGLAPLARQYFNFGRGRAANLLKHRARPRLRQAAVIAVWPMLVAAWAAPLAFALSLPALAWGCAALSGGLALALVRRSAPLALSGPVAMLMHLCWSMGFWSRVLAPPRPWA